MNDRFNKRAQRVFATVVTYNRLSDLKRCIGALRNQTLKIDLILVVNNGSTDGTQEWLTTQSDITTITQVNTGSAGGQYTAFKYAYEGEADWIWTMDDDVVPQSDALESLLDAANFVKEPSFLCSIVESGLEEGIIMNLPKVSQKKPKANYYSQWPKYLAQGLVEVEAATFVSLLVPASTIRKIGYPIKEFFMWADDTEFTQRCATVGPGYVVGKSRVLHLRATPEKIHIAYETDKGRIQNFVFSVRNKVYFLRKKFSGEQGSKLEKYGALVKKYLLDMYELRKSKAYTLLKLIIYHKGFLSGLRFAPSVERPKP